MKVENIREEELTSNTTNEKHPPAKEKISPKSLFVFALIVIVIVLPIRVYIAKPFIVSGASMFPSFNTWHYLLIDQISYRFAPPVRGDVIVFRSTQQSSKFFIKRIIGLPNETIQLEGTRVTVFNKDNESGFILDEPYVSEENQKETSMTTKLGDNEYFVMGDNRKVSYDSRYWGPLERNKITGRAYIRLFPFTSIDVFPGKTTYLVTNE